MSVKRVEVVERVKSPDRKKNKKANSALRHVRIDVQSMMNEVRLNSFIVDVLIMKEPVH